MANCEVAHLFMRPDFSTLVIAARESDRPARKKRVAVALRFLPSGR